MKTKREIKFRGRMHSGEWKYGLPMKVYKEGNELWGIHEENTECVYDVMPETIGQYIGERDKNGKEIYEDDVVWFWEKIINTETKEEETSDALGVVCYEYVDFMALTYEGEDIFGYGSETITLVGNIFDNKDLIDEVKNYKCE